MKYDVITCLDDAEPQFDVPADRFEELTGHEPGLGNRSPQNAEYYRLPPEFREKITKLILEDREITAGVLRGGQLNVIRLVPVKPVLPRKAVRFLGGQDDVDEALLPAEFREKHWDHWKGLWVHAQFYEIDGELYIGYEDPQEDLLHHWTQDGHRRTSAAQRERPLVRRNGEYLFSAFYDDDYQTHVKSFQDQKTFAVHTG